MKKIILITGTLFFFALAPQVFAEGFVPLAPIPGLTQGVVANPEGLAKFFNNLYKFAVGMAAMLAIVEIIWGGLEISTKDSVSKQSDGRNRIEQAILGLVLVLSPVIVFSIINPSILNLSINLPPLDTKSGVPSQTGGGTPSLATDATTGCVVTGTNGILQVAVCPSVETAQSWGQTCTSGNLSSITELATTNPANGVVTSKSVLTCTGRQSYVFIDPGGTFTSISRAINRLRPLVSAPGKPNNASDAASFANACSGAGIGWQTCMSDAPLVTFAVPCQLTGDSAKTIWKCYNEALSCINLTNIVSRGLCSDNPKWTPFQ